jgi:hypothetical protein
MYKVYMNNRVLKNPESIMGVFHDYELARSFVRKKIRQLVAKGKATKRQFQGGMAAWDEISRNPTACFSNGMFRVKRVV